MSVFKLANDHPLTKAGLRCVHAVEEAGRGLRPGDIVFEFPHEAEPSLQAFLRAKQAIDRMLEEGA